MADLTKKARGIVEQNRSVGLHGALFAVCDGMGGAAAGEVASQLAVDIVYERMVDGLKDAQGVSRDELARRLVRAIEAAGLRIFQEAKVDRARRGMGTMRHWPRRARRRSTCSSPRVGDSREVPAAPGHARAAHETSRS